ncbi:MAG: bifunctional proline dehydrogenase/L-glutamate gamma-semialdehyde dehydrogenase PutA [Caulobacteraceae bacterium]|nr:bifunctional proline dehydrogenase/L-glutamate gamma-semialdehyde dehydrogenase PutA [Caulobacteraceae bacterium]
MSATLPPWDSLDDGKYEDEAAAVARLLAAEPLGAEAETIRAQAVELVRAARRHGRRQGVVESFLREFGLSTREGLALMCLAEALLRTPDEAARDRLIVQAIGSADWESHLGRSDSLFVNLSTWALMLTGRLLEPEDSPQALAGQLRRLAGRVGEPLIRRALTTAVGFMSDQFVLGETIEAALARAARGAMMCSFDMLGEGARSQADAARYEASYLAAVAAVASAAGGVGPETGHGVSVKLSALHPRYEATKEAVVFAELYPRLKRIALAAAEGDINLSLDAEEADRLTLSLKLLERLAGEAELGEWRGLGLAVQAYQKRGPAVIDRLADLARSSGRRLMVRLVKGAYWDAEIKRAQVAGMEDYPVFTTKAATDVAYLVCAERLIAAAPALYAQFATHNAHTLTAVRHLAERRGVGFERQRLHGMGEALYAAAGEHEPFPLRVYAPVGGHEALLPYLVRRLLENGANTSFVHSLLDERLSPEAVAADPVQALKSRPDRHPKIPRPRDILMPERRAAAGLDLTIAAERARVAGAVAALDAHRATALPVFRDAGAEEIDRAFEAAHVAQRAWDDEGGAGRGRVLRAAADAMEAETPRLVALLAREAGKTLADAVAEVREAADFCRFYAAIAERDFTGPRLLPAPAGERNTLELKGRGVFVAISPWNFPLSIFTGQVAAALAAGDAVLAKPAEQTPNIAAAAVKLLHGAGLDPRLLALVPGAGETVGKALVEHPGCDGVAFTGGTDTGLAIARALAAREGPLAPLIAETGGLNGMFVDTTALREQVIDDVILSAFGSAGQRCSALRILFLPEETADSLLEGLAGAMDALVLGDPADPGTDVGPVIDAAALAQLTAHAERLAREARIVRRLPSEGLLFGPVLAEIPRPGFLAREVFGPILHVVRYRREALADAARALAATRYGLTLGVHSRLTSFADEVRRLVPAGNTYVNRSIIGAVVGEQPFGGEGLSGTGPKAGGPLALSRFAVERVVSVNTAAQGGDPALLSLTE